MEEEIQKTAKKTGVPVKKILDFLYGLRKGVAYDNKQLLQRVGVSKNALNQVKRGLSDFLKPSSEQSGLVPEACSRVQDLYQSDYKTEEEMWCFLEDKQYKEIVALLVKYQNRLPGPNRELDQFTATRETTAKRAKIMDFFEDIRGKRLLFIGDDDFTSVAVASLGTAREITVAEIDRRILNQISLIAKKEGLRIKTRGYDARKPLPHELAGKFDVVFTDPPYTEEGVRLFVSRGVEALDQKNHAARIYVCYGNSDRAKERFLPIYGIFVQAGLMMRWVFDKFNRYEGAEAIGSASSLYVGEITAKVKPPVKGNYDKAIYTYN